MDPLHATIEEFAADGYTHVKVLAASLRAPASSAPVARR